MMFNDRKDAGEQLARALAHYQGTGVMILAIPKGGVQVGLEVSKFLKAPLFMLIARKLPYPEDPEAGFGAVAEDGTVYIQETAYLQLSAEDIAAIKQEQLNEVKRRINVLRNGQLLPDLSGKSVILVDDGLAMGSTMKAAVMMCKNKNVKRIIVAVPVASSNVTVEMEAMADEVIVLETPLFFRAVAQVYKHWYDVSDEEVRKLLSPSGSQ
jgi:putative phosphoribosyl transferase